MSSNQDGLHPRLEEIVRRHLAHAWREPLHGPSVATFERLASLRAGAENDQPLVLDSGCGTGESTRRLAERHPDRLVIGIDRSAARLQKVGADETPVQEGNALWARAELATVWRLALEAGWRLSHHYLLYPNPCPKAAQLSRRWHGHPVFPTLLQLGGRVELRTNWRTYAAEFCAAVHFATGKTPIESAFDPDDDPLTPFERKYAASGHEIWRCVIELPNTSI